MIIVGFVWVWMFACDEFCVGGMVSCSCRLMVCVLFGVIWVVLGSRIGLRVAEFLSAWCLGYFGVTVGFIAGAGVGLGDGLFCWYLPVDVLGR